MFRAAFLPFDELQTSSIGIIPGDLTAGPSLNESDETATLRFMSRRPDLLSLLLGQLGLRGQVCIDVGVRRPFLPRHGRRGDIDFLAIPKAEVRRTVAIQAK